MTAEEAQATLEALGDHLDGIPEDELVWESAATVHA